MILELHGVTRRFGGLVAVDDVSLSVRTGELRCVIGPNGAGKSTLFDLIDGQLGLDQGHIAFDGTRIDGMSTWRIARLGIGRKFQAPSVFLDLSTRDNVAMAARGRDGLVELMRRRRDREVVDQAMSVLERVRLAHRANDQASELSHGERQWLEIAMVLATRCRLLLLDEPTAGMTAEETRETGLLLRELGGTLTTIVVEHDLKFVRDVADTVTVLHQGRVLAEGPADLIAGHDEVRRVYLGGHAL
jgi:urea transport system ATP-binding protein